MQIIYWLQCLSQTVMETRNTASRSAMDGVELGYAQQIYIYNDEVIQGSRTEPLISRMKEAATRFEDEVSDLLVITLMELSCVPSLLPNQ